jgi:universal stress protein E
VVVGVDFSLPSRRAVEFALRLVRGGEFYFVHVWRASFEGSTYGEDMHRKFQENCQAQMKKLVEEELAAYSASFGPGTPAICQVIKEGTVLEALREEIERLQPDLAVVGTHGRTGVERAFLGSIAEDMLSKPPCDVLAVRAL